MTKAELRQFQRRLERIEADLQLEFHSWVADMRANVSRLDIENAIMSGLTTVIEREMRYATPLDLNVSARITAEGTRALREITSPLGVFDPNDPRFQTAIESAVSHAIHQITEESLHAVRETIGRAHVEQWVPRQVSEQIRDSIGLTRRQARALLTQHHGMLSAGERIAQSGARTYAERLAVQRGKTISRHQVLQQANIARRAAFAQAARAGAFNPNDVELEWNAILDDHTCAFCADHDGDTTPFGSDFDGDFPPAHPSCRCTVSLSYR